MSQIYDDKFSLTKNLRINLYTTLTSEQGEHFSCYFLWKVFQVLQNFWTHCTSVWTCRLIHLRSAKHCLCGCVSRFTHTVLNALHLFVPCFVLLWHTCLLLFKGSFFSLCESLCWVDDVIPDVPVLCVFFLGATCFHMLQ